MIEKTEMIDRLVLPIALLALLGGLYDTGRLLGFGLGSQDPVQLFSISGFALLGSFAIARIFAAVGMWIRSNWGTPLLFATTLVELVVFLFAIADLDIGFLGFGFRLVQLAGSLFILFILYRAWHSSRHS